MMTWITDVYASPGLNDQLIILDDAWWRDQMETFPRYWSFVRGIHRLFPRTKASDADFLYFLWSAPEQTA